MPATRRKLDVNRDYVVTNGAPENDDTHTSTVVLLLTLVYGSMPMAPELGNRLFVGARKLDTSLGAEARAEQDCREALRPLTSTRAITGLEITATLLGDGAVGVDLSFMDAAGTERTIKLTLSRGA